MTVDGQPVSSFEYNKVRALLIYLVVESERPHRREALAGLLWPDQSQKAALDSLRNALSKLRQAIGDQHAEPPYLFITHDAIQFNRAGDHLLDLARFTSLISACQKHTHRRLESCNSCKDRLSQAVELYHGTFLEGFSLTDSDLFEDWLGRKRQKYHQVALDTLQKLASIFVWRNDFDLALYYTRRQLELDPYREEAYIQVMSLLAGKGLRAEACAQYEKCRDLLASELGVEPVQETTHLYEQIKYGTLQGTPRQPKQHNNLPPNLTSFVGRQKELAEINALIDNPDCHLLTLMGPGGVGKTRLAITAASGQLDIFQHGACFVPLAAVTSPELLVTTILEALGLTLTSHGDCKKQLLDYLRDKELILVLDNFEQLLDAASLVTEILHNAPGVLVLVTSRQRLSLQAEWLFEVNGLSYPSGREIGDLAAYDALQLFAQRLHQVKPRLTLFQDDLPSVSRICQLVEGLPLGIELAASAVRLRTIEQVAGAIESGKAELASPLRDVPERHRSLHAVFEHSWRLLSEPERQAFCGLAVFRGGFTAEAALQVAQADEGILSSLVDHSMLRYDPHANRYDLHELVRQFAQEKLSAQGREVTVQQRFLQYYIDLAERADASYMGSNRTEDYFILVPETDNFRSAMEWCFANDQMEPALRLAGALGNFWGSVLDNTFEADRWMSKILGCDYPFPHNWQFARALTRAGRLAQVRDIAAAISLAEQAVEYWRELSDEPWLAYSLSGLGRILIRSGDYARMKNLLDESQLIYHKLNDQVHLANVMFLLGQYYSDVLEDQLQARSAFEQCLAIGRQIGSDNMIARALGSLGNTYLYYGDFIQARSLFEESLNLIRDKADKPIMMWMVGSLGDVNIFLKDFPTAYTYLIQELEYYQNMGRVSVSTLCDLACLFYHKGDPEQALYFLKEAFGSMDSINSSRFPEDGTLDRVLGLLNICSEAERAAKLYAFMAAVRETRNANLYIYDRPEYERSLAETRRQLGEVAFAKAWEEGRSMTLEQAKACALGAKVRLSHIPEPQPQANLAVDSP